MSATLPPCLISDAMRTLLDKIAFKRGQFPPRKAIGEYDHDFRDRYRRERETLVALEGELTDLLLVEREVRHLDLAVSSEGPDGFGVWWFTELVTGTSFTRPAKPLPQAREIAEAAAAAQRAYVATIGADTTTQS